jgi:hypothetical protein
MLGMEVGLSAMGAREFSISILDRNDSTLSRSGSCSGSGGPARSAGENAAATLRTDDMGWHVVVGEVHVRRRNTRLGHDAAGGHRAQDRRAPGASGRGRNRLRMRGRGSGLGHHGSRSPIAGVRRVWVLGHRVHAGTAARLRSLLVRGQVMRRVGRVRRAWSARRVRVAPVERLHGRGGRLQRRQRLRQWRARLQLMRRDSGRRRISLCRSRVYTIGGVWVTVHNTARRNAVAMCRSWSRARVESPRKKPSYKPAASTETGGLKRVQVLLAMRSKKLAARRVGVWKPLVPKEVDEARCKSLSR